MSTYDVLTVCMAGFLYSTIMQVRSLTKRVRELEQACAGKKGGG